MDDPLMAPHVVDHLESSAAVAASGGLGFLCGGVDGGWVQSVFAF